MHKQPQADRSGCSNYESTNGCYPGGSYSTQAANYPAGYEVWSTYYENFSCFARMLPFFEQSPMYNAINFSEGTSAASSNLTIAGVAISTLVCPSDTQNQTLQLPQTRTSPPGTSPGWSWNTNPALFPTPASNFTQAFTSYGGNAGTFTFGFTNLMPSTVLAQFNGVIYNDSYIKIAGVTDGTSNTFMFGEHSKGHLYLLDPGYAVSDNSWNSGRWYDTLFATLYPMNLLIGNNINFGANNASYYYPTCGRQLPPGRRQLRSVRRLGSLRQEHDQLVDVQYGKRR